MKHAIHSALAGTLVLIACAANVLASDTIDGSSNGVTYDDHQWHFVGDSHQNGYEWYYFDIEAEDGTHFAFQFTGPNPLDPRFLKSGMKNGKDLVGIRVQVGTPDGSKYEIEDYYLGAQHLQFNRQAQTMELSIGDSGRVRMSRQGNGLPVFDVSLDARDERRGTRMKGEFTFTSTMPSWKYNDGFLYQGTGELSDDFHRWVVAVPRANVKGQYSFAHKGGSREAQVAGLGYHDHNWGTQMMNTLDRGWYWGRVYTPTKTLIYASILPLKRPNKFGYAGDSIVFLATADKVLLDTNQVTFSFPEEKRFAKADNRMKYPSEFSFSATSPTDGKTFAFEVGHQSVLNDSFSYYLRNGTEVQITCPAGSCESETGVGIVELMDLKKLMSWYVLSAFGLSRN